MAKTICKIFGVVLLLVGIVGFLNDHLLGMHLTGIHNVVHLLTAVIALYFGFAGSASAARTFCLVFGVIYLLLGVLGFIKPELVASVIQAHETVGLTPDNAVHILLGAVFLVVGLLRSPETATT